MKRVERGDGGSGGEEAVEAFTGSHASAREFMYGGRLSVLNRFAVNVRATVIFFFFSFVEVVRGHALRDPWLAERTYPRPRGSFD
jgi:hypothetical protein